MQLIVNSPGSYVTQKDSGFRLKSKEKSMDISALKVESIVFTNQAMLTTQAVVLALEHNIDVVFLDKYGSPMGRIWFSKLGSTALIRRMQLRAADAKLGLDLTIELVNQKMSNQLGFLKKLMYARPDKHDLFQPSLDRIERCQEQINNLHGDLEECRSRIMGLEGTAARSYFGIISQILPQKYRFDGRSFRPAKDAYNAALNYAYGMLYSTVEKSCILAGLDPYVGFLHTDNYNKKSMVFDLIEPFRIMAEQTVTYLFTGRKIKDEYFFRQDHGVSLNDQGKPVVVSAMNEQLDESIRYKGRNVKRRYIVQHEAHRIGNILLESEGHKRKKRLEFKEF